MTSFNDAGFGCLDIDGVISIKEFNETLYQNLGSIVLWEHKYLSKFEVIKFESDSWRATGHKKLISYHGVSPQYKFQLKALTLGMYTQGKSEGMPPAAWSSIGAVVSNLKRFAKYLQKHDINSFLELSNLPELKQRNIILGLVKAMRLKKHPSYAVSLLTAFYWLKNYQLVKSEIFFDLAYEYLTPFCQLKKELANKHSIIPINVLKQGLAECEACLEEASKILPEWIYLQTMLNGEISKLPSSKFTKSSYIDSDVLSEEELIRLKDHNALIKKVRTTAYMFVLSFTGMRFNEAMALTDDSAFKRDGKYYLKSLLSKTTENTQELEWITNELCYRAVKVMEQINRIYRDRAFLILKYHADALPVKRRINLEFGLKEKTLFGVQPHIRSCEFSSHGKSSTNSVLNLNKFLKIALTEQDIKALERMGCNYQSVSSSHKNFKQPYQVGDLFNFTPHQFRHTFAWFIIANRLGDLDDIKYQYKHLDSMMSLVYCQRGYESMEEMIGLVSSFSEYLTSVAMEDMVSAAQEGTLAGKGGQNFITRLGEIMVDDITTGSTPHFKSMEELIAFVAKHTSNFRGVSHGYCTKGAECKVRNVADPSHCVWCDSYIATPKHLPQWLVIKQKCQTQLEKFEKLPAEVKHRFKAFISALNDNLEAANIIIDQLTISVKEA